jgi:hypothetical protein
MPELHRRPRRRLNRGGRADGDFTCEREVREAVAALRAAHATVAEAEVSAEWRALSRRVARWILRTAKALPFNSPEGAALAIARVYLRRPELLPAMPPGDFDEGEPHE